MNQETMLQIARECGLYPVYAATGGVGKYVLSAAQLDQFATRIRQEALSEAAKECQASAPEEYEPSSFIRGRRYGHADCATAILSLKDKS